MPKLFIIIPCYNEEGNIKELLNEIEVLSCNNSLMQLSIGSIIKTIPAPPPN